MVGIAQLVESRIVIPVVVGSSPISHPIIAKRVTRLSCPFAFSTLPPPRPSRGYCDSRLKGLLSGK